MPFTRRDLLLGAGSVAAAPLAAQKKTAPARPNIVLVLADDLGAWMLGCYGNQEIRTPNIDRLLGRAGTRFLNSFVATPICSPSRATLFTGRLPRQHGIHDFLTRKPIDAPPQGQEAPPDSFKNEIMVSDILAQAGYNCGYVGKWHMGNDAEPGHGYKYTCTLAGANYQNPRFAINGKIEQQTGYLADVTTQRACDFIDQQNAERPFFMVASYLNPHMPYSGHPQKYYDMYANTKFETIGWEPGAPHALREKEMLSDIVGNIRHVAAATTALDDQIPVLLSRIQQRGFRDNTLVIFTGDNGFLLGRHGLWSKGHASNPINMYEEVVQTPMIWYWPGKAPAEATRPEMISFYDFLPTICDLIEVPVPAGRNIIGRSYLPIVTGAGLPKKEVWRNLVFGHFRNTEMARDTRYKLVLRDGGKGPNELFDLRADPRERVNQYANPEFITVRDRLTRELETWRKRTV